MPLKVISCKTGGNKNYALLNNLRNHKYTTSNKN